MKPECSIGNRNDESCEIRDNGICAIHGALLTANREAFCGQCGWDFIVLAVPLTPEYRNASWYCPHCGYDNCAEVTK